MVREIGVGIRIDMDEGLSFSGIEEVNGLINRGGRVASIEPGGVLMRELREDGKDVHLTLSGCELKVIVDDSAVESSPQTQEHDRLYKEGADLIRPYMQLVDFDHASPDSDAARASIDRGIEFLNRALTIDPANWAAHWIIGKAHQALGNSEAACDSFGKAYLLQKGNADVAREYMFECLNLGRHAKGIVAARHAIALKPDDSGLMSNLALALLVGGQLDKAAKAVEEALALAPDDQITRHLKDIIEDVRTGRRKQPETLAELENRSETR